MMENDVVRHYVYALQKYCFIAYYWFYHMAKKTLAG